MFHDPSVFTHNPLGSNIYASNIEQAVDPAGLCGFYSCEPFAFPG